MAETEAVTARDVEFLSAWCAAQGAPAEVQKVATRVVRLVAGIESLKTRHKKLLELLRQAMGITPKSERGATIANQ